jgi:hypothetical protein
MPKVMLSSSYVIAKYNLFAKKAGIQKIAEHTAKGSCENLGNFSPLISWKKRSYYKRDHESQPRKTCTFNKSLQPLISTDKSLPILVDIIKAILSNIL